MAAFKFGNFMFLTLTVDERAVADVQQHRSFCIIVIGENNADIIQAEIIGILKRQFHMQCIVRRIEKVVGQIGKLPSAFIFIAVINTENAVALKNIGRVPRVGVIFQRCPYGHGTLNLHAHNILIFPERLAVIFFSQNKGVVNFQRNLAQVKGVSDSGC